MRHIMSILSIMAMFVLLVVVLTVGIVSATPKCEHEEMGKKFSFQFENSTAVSDMRPFCKNCDESFSFKNFRGTPTDLSFLDAIVENSDGNEIVGGEYYTMTAIMTDGGNDIDKIRISCKVQNEDVIVFFSVEFREEFKDAVEDLHMGEEITFRGRFYDEGCGFTDCELISRRA